MSAVDLVEIPYEATTHVRCCAGWCAACRHSWPWWRTQTTQRLAPPCLRCCPSAHCRTSTQPSLHSNTRGCCRRCSARARRCEKYATTVIADTRRCCPSATCLFTRSHRRIRDCCRRCSARARRYDKHATVTTKERTAPLLSCLRTRDCGRRWSTHACRCATFLWSG